MDEIQQPSQRRRNARVATAAVGLVVVGAIGGGVLAASVSASAGTNASAAPKSTASGAPAAPGWRGPDQHGPDSVRPGEKALTGSNAARVKAAALKQVPGGTVFRVETDADGDAYEAHMTKADGSEVTVKFDKNFTVTGTEAAMGKGGPPHN